MNVPFASEVVVQDLDFLEAVVVFPADLECFLFLVGISEELWTRSAVDA